MVIRFPAGAAMLLASAIASASPASDTPEAAFDRYRAKINLHRFEALEEDVIAKDALFAFAGEVHRGIDQARAAFNRTWSIIPDEVYTMDSAEWLARDSATALVAFRYSYRGTMADGTALSGGGHGTNLFRRTAEGWRLAYEHLSPAPASNAERQP